MIKKSTNILLIPISNCHFLNAFISVMSELLSFIFFYYCFLCVRFLLWYCFSIGIEIFGVWQVSYQSPYFGMMTVMSDTHNVCLT